MALTADESKLVVTVAPYALVFNTTTNSFSGNITTTAGFLLNTATSPTNNSLAYVSGALSQNIQAINPVSFSAGQTISLIPSNEEELEFGGMAFSQDGTKLYVANRGTESVQVLNTSNNALIGNIPLSSNPEGIVTTSNGRVYVCKVTSDSVAVINGETNTVITNITVGDGPETIGINPNETFAYVLNTDSNNISVINLATLVVDTVIPVGNGPLSIAFLPDGSKAYVTNSQDRTISVINTATNTVTQTFYYSTFPFDIVIPSSGSIAYLLSGTDSFAGSSIPANGSVYLSIIDLTSGQILSSYETFSVNSFFRSLLQGLYGKPYRAKFLKGAQGL